MSDVKEQGRLIDVWGEIFTGLDALKEFEPERKMELRGKAFAYCLGCEYLLPGNREKALKAFADRVAFLKESLEKHKDDDEWKIYFSMNLKTLEEVILPHLERVL